MGSLEKRQREDAFNIDEPCMVREVLIVVQLKSEEKLMQMGSSILAYLVPVYCVFILVDITLSRLQISL